MPPEDKVEFVYFWYSQNHLSFQFSATSTIPKILDVYSESLECRVLRATDIHQEYLEGFMVCFEGILKM